jgi:hypothetical protein
VGDDWVPVDVDLAASVQDDLIATLEDTEPGGETPTASALERALSYFTEGPGSAVDGIRAVLLVTDGGPTCNADLACSAEECALNLDGSCAETTSCCDADGGALFCVDHERTTQAIADLASAGVGTVVVSVSGSEPYVSWLDDFAITAGTPNPLGERDYAALEQGPVALTQLLRRGVARAAGVCRLPMLGPVPESFDADFLNVAIDCEPVPQQSYATFAGAAGAGPIGVPNWFVDESSDPGALEIVGKYCAALEQGFERVDVVLAHNPLQ